MSDLLQGVSIEKAYEAYVRDYLVGEEHHEAWMEDMFGVITNPNEPPATPTFDDLAEADPDLVIFVDRRIRRYEEEAVDCLLEWWETRRGFGEYPDYARIEAPEAELTPFPTNPELAALQADRRGYIRSTLLAKAWPYAHVSWPDVAPFHLQDKDYQDEVIMHLSECWKQELTMAEQQRGSA